MYVLQDFQAHLSLNETAYPKDDKPLVNKGFYAFCVWLFIINNLSQIVAMYKIRETIAYNK